MGTEFYGNSNFIWIFYKWIISNNFELIIIANIWFIVGEEVTV